MRRDRKGLLIRLVLLGMLLPGAGHAASDFYRYYKTGVSAAETKDWALVEDMMQRAIEAEPEEKAHLLLHRGGYFPHFYLGLARYHLGDCEGALAVWAESDQQGAIVGQDEYLELLRLQKDCEDHGRPSVSEKAPSSAAEPASVATERTAVESEPTEQRGGGEGVRPTTDGGRKKTTGKEKVRTGQFVVEEGAEPARKTLGALEKVAPEGSKFARVTHRTKQGVDVAETATDVVDVSMRHSKDLEAAVNAYFAGKPQRTLELLEALDLSDSRLRAQVYLFRSAAHFRLHLLVDRDQDHLTAARENARLFNREQWRKDFPTELFDPRFVKFVHGAG